MTLSDIRKQTEQSIADLKSVVDIHHFQHLSNEQLALFGLPPNVPAGSPETPVDLAAVEAAVEAAKNPVEPPEPVVDTLPISEPPKAVQADTGPKKTKLQTLVFG